ncbi:hypothetical protein ACQ3I4_00350 [Zafaria sp. Z1313]|uniref:hypothetical protein n=1 Tax=unclassified Zafaria TaxID=2828765 RepID=UPI002E7838D9|nr:hypothetical protein [Zafaria sp. J156]MEE1619836.1 hypothetical protein [Zafaria sp. J156]
MPSTPTQDRSASPPRGPQDGRPTAPRLAAWTRAAFLLVLLAYPLSMLQLPWKAAAVVVGIAGIAAGVVAAVLAFRGPAPLVLRVSLPLATAACLLFTASAGMQLLFYQPTLDYERCVATSVTDRSAAQCTRDYEDKLRRLEGIYGT